MLDLLAFGVLVLCAFYLLGLGLCALFQPARAVRFLSGFVTSARVHFLELALRIVAGWALITWSPYSLQPRIFTLLGWVLVASSAVLAVLPWRWHARFAQQSVPAATRWPALIGAASVAMGVLLAWAALAPAGITRLTTLAR